MLKMNNKETDKNILALAHVINIEMLHLNDMIKEVLKHKKSTEWDKFESTTSKMQNEIDSYIEEMEKSLVNHYGVNTINASREIATNRLDGFIKQDNLFKEVLLYRGNPYHVEYMINGKDLRVCNIASEPTKKGTIALEPTKKCVIELVRKLEILVKSKLKIKNISIKSLSPLDKAQLQKMEGEIVKNTEGLKYVVDGVFRENKTDMIIVKREHKLTSEEFTRKFKYGTELIGNWSELEGR